MTRANVHALLGDFLHHNPTVYLDVMEYIEATKFSDVALKQFRTFCRYFHAGNQKTNQWLIHRKAFFTVTRGVPAYRTIDWSGEAYWHTIPLIDKETIRSKSGDFLNSQLDRRLLWKRPTTGTTGPPVDIFYSRKTHFDFQLYSSCRIAWVAGALTRDALTRPVFCLALDDNIGIPDRVWADPSGFRGLTVRLKFNERQLASSDELETLLRKYDPAILTLKPNVMRSIVQRLVTFTDLGGSGLKLVVSSGSPLDADLRVEAQRLFGVPIINAYGLSEFGVVASECRYRSGLHLYDQHLVAEVLREDGTIAVEGDGELLFSSSANDAMPFLRFRTGDLGTLKSRSCPCGKEGLVIAEVSGRASPTFRLPDNSEFYPTNLKCLFNLFPVREFQLTQVESDRVHAEIEFLPSCTDRIAQIEMIKTRIQTEMGPLMTVTVNETHFRPDDKFQRFRTLLG